MTRDTRSIPTVKNLHKAGMLQVHIGLRLIGTSGTFMGNWKLFSTWSPFIRNRFIKRYSLSFLSLSFFHSVVGLFYKFDFDTEEEKILFVVKKRSRQFDGGTKAEKDTCWGRKKKWPQSGQKVEDEMLSAKIKGVYCVVVNGNNGEKRCFTAALEKPPYLSILSLSSIHIDILLILLICSWFHIFLYLTCTYAETCNYNFSTHSIPWEQFHL